MKYTAVKELKCQKKWLLLHPKLSWQVVGGSGVGRVRWWCGTGQLIRIELCGSVQILGLDVGEGDEDSPKICALPHNSFLIHCPAIWLKEVLLDVYGGGGTGQLIRKELCGSVQILGLDAGEGDEDSPKICALPHNSFLIHCPAIWLTEVLLDVYGGGAGQDSL
jgi:hypothetical protein